MALSTRITKLLVETHKDGGKFRFNLVDLGFAHLVGQHEQSVMKDVQAELVQHKLFMFEFQESEYAIASAAEVEAEGGIVVTDSELEHALETLGTPVAVARYLAQKGKPNN